MEMLRAFHDLVTADTSEAPKALGDLRVMQGVRKFPQRVKCAMLSLARGGAGVRARRWRSDGFD